MTLKSLLSPRQIAERIVAELQVEGLTDYPFIPADLDDELHEAETPAEALEWP